MAGIEDIGGGAVAARNGCPLKLSPVFVLVLEGRWAARQPLGPEIHAVTWLEPAYPLTRASAPRERAVLMRSSECGASPRPEASRAGDYGNRRP
jgi:hypothetical protein